MRFQSIAMLAASVVLILCGCSTYMLGYEEGLQDGQSGLSRTPARHSELYSEATRAEFAEGYESGYNEGIQSYNKSLSPSASVSKGTGDAYYGEPLTAVMGQGTVTIMEGNRRVSVCKTASPNIEETRFINEQQEIVVKSRGSHGPATAQLFRTSDGTETGKVMAYDICDGLPSWAVGMEE